MTTDELDNALAFAASDEHSGDLRVILSQAKSACRTLAKEVTLLRGLRAKNQPADEQAIRERCEAATPEPWQECGASRHGCKCGMVWSLHVDCCVAAAIGAMDEDYTCGEGVDEAQKKRNAEFIAHAREDVPYLMQLVEGLREALGSLVDRQNGPPLVRHEQLWYASMVEVHRVLGNKRGETFYREEATKAAEAAGGDRG